MELGLRNLGRGTGEWIMGMANGDWELKSMLWCGLAWCGLNTLWIYFGYLLDTFGCLLDACRILTSFISQKMSFHNNFYESYGGCDRCAEGEGVNEGEERMTEVCGREVRKEGKGSYIGDSLCRRCPIQGTLDT